MAYSRTTAPIQCMYSGLGTAGRRMWSYQSADARATVEGTEYFTDGVRDGMKVGDHVVVSYTTGYVTTIHSVIAVTSVGASINPAVLA